MNEVSFPAVSAPPPVVSGRGSAALPLQRAASAEPAPSAARSGATSDLTSQFKVKTALRSTHSFTYTFFDAKTLELLGSWPEQPVYRIAAQSMSPGAALQAIV